jgi:hypothetical protein
MEAVMTEFRALLVSLSSYFAEECRPSPSNTERYGTIGREDVPRLSGFVDKPAHEWMLRDCGYVDRLARQAGYMDARDFLAGVQLDGAVPVLHSRVVPRSRSALTMATALTKPVRREVASLHHGALIVTLAPEGVYFREKRRRTSYLLPYGVGFQKAVGLVVEQQRRERDAARKAKRTTTRKR